MNRLIRSAVVISALFTASKLAAQARTDSTVAAVDEDVAALYRLFAARAGARPLTGPGADTIRFEVRAWRHQHSAVLPALLIRAEHEGYQGYRIDPGVSDKDRSFNLQALRGEWTGRVVQLDSSLRHPSSPGPSSTRYAVPPLVVDGAGLAIEWRQGREYRVWFFTGESHRCRSRSNAEREQKALRIDELICSWLQPQAP